MSIMEFFTNPYFLIALTFVVFVGAQYLQRLTGIKLLNPILVSVAVMICLLCGLGVDYETYEEGGEYIDFWLKPAVVALGVPLYRQLGSIKRQIMPLLMAETAGCLMGLVSVIAVAKLFGASREIIISLAPKAVTTPIAIEISNATGGLPALTAAVVVCTGIFGSIAGFKIIKMSRIRSIESSGLSIGTAAHAMGTSAAMERDDTCGAFSSLGLILNGLLTALFAPYILHLMGCAI